MAPTTLEGQKTTTSQLGRNHLTQGNPIKVSEIFSQIDGVAYVERIAMTSPANYRKAKAAIKKAFTYQLEGKGFTMVELLSTCPVNWGMVPADAMKWIDEKMTQTYKPGVYKDINHD